MTARGGTKTASTGYEKNIAQIVMPTFIQSLDRKTTSLS